MRTKRRPCKRCFFFFFFLSFLSFPFVSTHSTRQVACCEFFLSFDMQYWSYFFVKLELKKSKLLIFVTWGSFWMCLIIDLTCNSIASWWNISNFNIYQGCNESFSFESFFFFFLEMISKHYREVKELTRKLSEKTKLNPPMHRKRMILLIHFWK